MRREAVGAHDAELNALSEDEIERGVADAYENEIGGAEDELEVQLCEQSVEEIPAFAGDPRGAFLVFVVEADASDLRH